MVSEVVAQWMPLDLPRLQLRYPERAGHCVSIIDEHTRECLGSLVERSITADVLIDELGPAAPGSVATRPCCAGTTDPNFVSAWKRCWKGAPTNNGAAVATHVASLRSRSSPSIRAAAHYDPALDFVDE